MGGVRSAGGDGFRGAHSAPVALVAAGAEEGTGSGLSPTPPCWRG